MNDIEKRNINSLVDGGSECLASFFVPGDIDRAFRESDWDVREMVEVLMSIVRSEETRSITKRDGTLIEESIVTPKERMAAIKMLRDLGKDAMVLGGYIQNQRLHMEKVLDDGTKLEYDTEAMSVMKDGSSRLTNTMALLEHSVKRGEIIDVDYVEKDEANEHRRCNESISDDRGTDGRGHDDGRHVGGEGNIDVPTVCSTERSTTGSDPQREQRKHESDNAGTKSTGEKNAGNPKPRRVPVKYRNKSDGQTGKQHEPTNVNDGKPTANGQLRPHVPGTSSLETRLTRLEEARNTASGNITRRTENGSPTDQRTIDPDERGDQSVTANI